ncbi:MAG: hypothetical protein HYR72_09130 [Deltaproteobacteria bacterium]|nr:hypothetical protein [Deltaproteobacteria bacterium]MBI3388920.1 hypothetical protein [Deltaproteobacteria bacterium]
MPKGKGLIRSLNRQGTRPDKTPRGAVKAAPLADPTVCQRCGAIYAHRTWRRNHKATMALFDRAAWTVCPGCQQVEAGQYFGRVLIRGAYALANETTLRQRIRNVDARARVTQPERRVISVAREGAVLEVLTTSQKLAHRIVHELKKAFRGRAAYHWSDDDGSLIATWQRDDAPPARAR